MKNNKRLLFTLCGFAGGAAGALLAELVPLLGHTLVLLVLSTACWFACAGGLITIGLFAAGETYNRRPFSVGIYRKGLLSGVVSGGIAGFIAQSVYSFQGEPNFFNLVVFKAFCWAIMGALLGWRLSTVVPNLGLNRGLLAGAIGGFVGGIGFMITAEIFAAVTDRNLLSGRSAV